MAPVLVPRMRGKKAAVRLACAAPVPDNPNRRRSP
jgi:hypothetical protein